MKMFKTNLYACSVSDVSSMAVLAKRSSQNIAIGDNLYMSLKMSDTETIQQHELSSATRFVPINDGRSTLILMTAKAVECGVLFAIELPVEYVKYNSLQTYHADELCELSQEEDEAIAESDRIISLLTYDRFHDGCDRLVSVVVRANRICAELGCSVILTRNEEGKGVIYTSNDFAGGFVYASIGVLAMYARMYDHERTLHLNISDTYGKTMLNGGFGVMADIELPALDALSRYAKCHGLRFDVVRQKDRVQFGITPYYPTAEGYDVMHPSEQIIR